MKDKKTNKKTSKKVDKKQDERNLLYGYIKLTLIIGATIVPAFLIKNWYHTTKEYQMMIPVLNEVVREIKLEELDSYVLESDKTIIYLCKVDDKKCRSFEKEFKKIIKRDELQEKIIYINLSDAKKNSVDKLETTYEVELTGKPLLMLFENGVFKNHLEPNKILEVEDFLESNGVKSENE